MKPSLNHSIGNEVSYFSSASDAEMGLKAYDTLNQSKNSSKNTLLDLKKLDLTKDPVESSSSLELLILLLHKSLKFSLEEILGLFTNNNKYLAHIIVKGIHEKFEGLRTFFELMNENISTLLKLFLENQDDVLACLYALKPGFISKDEKCAKSTIDLFKNFGQEIYNWFISKESKCNQTLLLGLKRHEKLSENYAELLFSIIKGNEVEYFSTEFMISTSSETEFMQITTKLIPHFENKEASEDSEESLIDLLENNGVFEKWFELGQKLYESVDMDNKLIYINFVCDFMVWLPRVIEKNAMATNLLRRNWQNLKMTEFIPLVNQLLVNLEKLNQFESSMSRKLISIIMDIFNQTYHKEEKREFIVQGLLSVIDCSSSLSFDIFITNYPPNHVISSSDFMLIFDTIRNLEDEEKLMKIVDFLKDMFLFDILNNHSLGGFIIQIVKKIVNQDSREINKFINNLLKGLLSSYVSLFIKSKNHLKSVQNQEQLSNKKKNSESPSSTEKSETVLFNKKMDLTISIVEKIIDFVLETENAETYIEFFKNYVLVTNSEIKKINFGMSTKRITNLLQKKLKITKEEELAFDEENPNQSLTKAAFKLSESLVSGKPRENLGVIQSLSRIQVPDKVSKEFEAIIAKRKKDEELKIEEELKKKKEEELKKILHKKEIEKMNLIKGGFGEGEAQLKEEGFWNRFVKENEEVKIYLSQEIEDAHLEGAELIMKKYSKLFRYFFTNYSNTMYISKTSNFDENSQRKELLSAVEIIKFLKDYTLILATNLQEVQTIIKDINIKVFQRKEVVNEVDYEGFEEFIKQFCLCVWNRNQWRIGSKENNLKFDHLTLPELLMNFIIYIRNVFKVKGENMNLFDVAEIDHKSSSPEVQELNEKLESNPNYILPEGFKKITDKKIDLKFSIKEELNFSESHSASLEVLDEILFDTLGVHIIEPRAVKLIKITVKPFHQLNVKERDPFKIKARALSTMIERKYAVQSSLGLLPAKVEFSKGIKKGMLSLKPDEKIIGEQVAYKLQEILNKINVYENEGEESPNKLKDLQKLALPEKKRSFSVQKIQPLEKNKINFPTRLEIVEKSETYVLSKKQKKFEEEKKRQEKEELKQKRKKEEDEKYFVELKLKLEEKRSNEALESSRIRAAEEKEREKKLEKKQKISEFTTKQVEKYKNMFEEIIDRKKREEEDKEMKNEDEEEKMRRIREKIDSENKVLAQIRKETTEAIMDLLYGQGFKSMTKEYEVPLRTVFELLEKHNSNPLSKKKVCPGEIDIETWTKFNKIFELSPLIVSPKDVITIFKSVTKEKIAKKEYSVGINYEEFLHCLLRECIKQKTIFGKIAERIKDEKQSITQTDNKGKKSKSVSKKIEAKNEFEEDEETDIRKLLKESDIRDDVIDHYGDVSKFSLESFRGLIYYLRMPFTKKGQEARIKELIELEKKQESQHVSNLEKLKEKLKMEYRLERYEKKDTKNSETTKAEKTESKQLKNHPKVKNLQSKTDTKEKNDKNLTDQTNTNKIQKK